METRVFKSKFLVGYNADSLDVPKLQAKLQLFHDIKYVLGSENLNLPVVATRQAFVVAQERNEFKVVHNGGVEGWAREQGDMLRAMCRHVQQKAVMKPPPKWYVGMHLEHKDTDTATTAVAVNGASSKKKIEKELTDAKQEEKTSASKSTASSSKSWKYEFDRDTFTFQRREKHAKGSSVPQLALKVYIQGADDADCVMTEFNGGEMHEFEEVTVGEYRDHKARLMGSSTGAIDENKNRTAWTGRLTARILKLVSRKTGTI